MVLLVVELDYEREYTFGEKGKLGQKGIVPRLFCSIGGELIVRGERILGGTAEWPINKTKC